MYRSKSGINPLRSDAILTDENGRKWRVVNPDRAVESLEPDHANCPLPCSHYGELFL